MKDQESHNKQIALVQLKERAEMLERLKWRESRIAIDEAERKRMRIDLQREREK